MVTWVGLRFVIVAFPDQEFTRLCGSLQWHDRLKGIANQEIFRICGSSR